MTRRRRPPPLSSAASRSGPTLAAKRRTTGSLACRIVSGGPMRSAPRGSSARRMAWWIRVGTNRVSLTFAPSSRGDAGDAPAASVAAAAAKRASDSAGTFVIEELRGTTAAQESCQAATTVARHLRAPTTVLSCPSSPSLHEVVRARGRCRPLVGGMRSPMVRARHACLSTVRASDAGLATARALPSRHGRVPSRSRAHAAPACRSGSGARPCRAGPLYRRCDQGSDRTTWRAPLRTRLAHRLARVGRVRASERCRSRGRRARGR